MGEEQNKDSEHHKQTDFKLMRLQMAKRIKFLVKDNNTIAIILIPKYLITTSLIA